MNENRPPATCPGFNGDLTEVKNILNRQNEVLESQGRMLVEIRSVLLGVPDTDDRGLCGEVKEVSASHYSLRKSFWMLVAFLLGTGVLTGVGIGITDLVKIK